MKGIVFGFCFVLAVSLAAKKSEVKSEDYEEEFMVPFNGQKFDSFDWQLCTEVAKVNPGNVLISPVSVKFLLNMLYEGSTGDTAKELEKKLQLPEDKNVARMKTSAVLRSLQASHPKYIMEIGTKIFVDESTTPKNWFQRILFLYYNAYIEKMNFTDYKTTIDKINNWVESVTHGHIKDLVSQGNLNEATMILVNAIYFKGTWKSFFQPEDSFVGDFETVKGPKKITYMKQTSNFYYARSPEINAQILRLPYEGQKFAMYIILPEEKNGLERLIKNVDPVALRKQIWQMEETSTEVIMPKFKFDYKTDMKPVLRKLGLNKIFDSFGEMKGLIQNNRSSNLVVSSVLQKAGIEVNEEGSVAAAASEMQLINKIGIQDELFNASHPFLFFIEDETTGTIVFVGKFVEPDVEAVKEAKPPKSSNPATAPATATTTKKTLPTAISASSSSSAPTGTPSTTSAPPSSLNAYRRVNSTLVATTRQQNSPKLFELKQKKIKAEMRPSTLHMLGGGGRVNEGNH